LFSLLTTTGRSDANNGVMVFNTEAPHPCHPRQRFPSTEMSNYQCDGTKYSRICS